MTLKRYSILKHLNIDKVIFNGFGLAHNDGVSILVYQGIPGDNVDVKLVHKRGNTYFGEIVKYNRRSSHQIPVRCKSFEECGGCDWLNIDYSTQLSFKQDIVAEVFNEYIKKGFVIGKITPSPKTDHYRNKIILPVTNIEGQIKTGMYARRSHKVIPHNECMLHPAHTDDIIKLAEESMTKANCSVYDEKTGKGSLRFLGIRYSETKKQHLLIIVTKSGKLPFSKTIAHKLSSNFPSVTGIVQDINAGDSNRNLSSQHKILFGKDYIEEELAQTILKIHYSSFFQINTYQCLNVLQEIKSHLKPSDIVIDAYSGIGTIGIFIAPQVNQVYCLEQHPQAVRNGLANIEANNTKNTCFIGGDVIETLPETLKKNKANTIIIDPPRKGLDKNTVEVINQNSFRKIIYLSCNISTQKRDLDLFMRSGFVLKTLKPFDMFPHTHHIECLAILER